MAIGLVVVDRITAALSSEFQFGAHFASGSRAMSKHLTTLRQIARVMDDAVRVPGTDFRIGLDAILGLFPGLGDVAGGLTTAYTIVVAQQMGAPKAVLLRMLWNVLVDTVVGSVPVLGDVFDAAYRANRRNVNLVEKYSLAPTETERSSKGFVAVLLIGLALIVIGGITVTYLLVRALWQLIF
jgi:hypothetical protein